MTAMIPAIDVRAGQVVRLQQGDYQRQTTYAPEPLALACSYAELGAEYLHLVDLDAARLGGFSLHGLVESITKHTPLLIQAGGGVRSRAHILAMQAAGVQRVVIGTLALTEQNNVRQWLEEFGPDAITLALDVQADANGIWQCASHGWTTSSGKNLDAVIDFYSAFGLQHVLCTDIARDGLLSGYNSALYQHLRQQWPTLAVQASGGVCSLDDIRAMKQLGVSGAILGRALLEGAFTLPEALAC